MTWTWTYFVKIESAVVLHDEDEDGEEGEEDQMQGVNLLASSRSQVDLIAAHIHAVLGHHRGRRVRQGSCSFPCRGFLDVDIEFDIDFIIGGADLSHDWRLTRKIEALYAGGMP